MGAYTAFLDLALGFGTPALGAVAAGTGLGVVFLVSAIAALATAAIAAGLLHRSQRVRHETSRRDDCLALPDRLDPDLCGAEIHADD
jgi:hypothetical protein